jgi:hypothetical protein
MKKQLLSEEFTRMQKLAGIINEIKAKPGSLSIPKGWKELSVDEDPDLEEDIEIESYGAPMEGWDTNNLDTVTIYSTPEIDAWTEEPIKEKKYFVKVYISFGDWTEDMEKYDTFIGAKTKAIEIMNDISSDWADDEGWDTDFDDDDDDDNEKNMSQNEIKSISTVDYFKIGKHKEEALSALKDFAYELEFEDMFEFIPDLENYKVDPQTNSIYIEEFGSVYLIPNEGPVPSELEEYMSESGDGEINQDGPSWKKYPKNGYYYIVVF